jgi:hypothetical protein
LAGGVVVFIGLLWVGDVGGVFYGEVKTDASALVEFDVAVSLTLVTDFEGGGVELDGAFVDHAVRTGGYRYRQVGLGSDLAVIAAVAISVLALKISSVRVGLRVCCFWGFPLAGCYRRLP